MSKKITSQDVADLAGVSRTTVSMVLNEVEGVSIPPQTREKVRNAVDQLGYIPNASAQALANRRAQAIGLVMTRSPHHIASDTFLPQILGGLLEVIQQHKFRLLIESVELKHQDKVYLELARAKRIDGMILLTPRIDDIALKYLEDEDIHAVMIGNLTSSSLYSVDVNNQLAAKTATNYLIKLGHTKIACISNAPPSYTASMDRVAGYQAALREANLPVDRTLIRYGSFDPNSGFERMNSLLNSRKEFTAVFVCSDNVAMGAKSALYQSGYRVPEDISMIGFDDIPWARYSSPPLTTIRLPAQQLAIEASQILLNLLKGQKPTNRKISLATELVIRQSCRAL